MNQHRLQYEMFSDRNPLMQPVAGWAEVVRASRRKASADNPFLAMEHVVSETITSTLDMLSNARDMMVELVFSKHLRFAPASGYGGTACRAAGAAPPHERDLTREAAASRMAAELRQRIDQGGLAEAVVRALILSAGPAGRWTSAASGLLRRSMLRSRRPGEWGSRV